MTQFSEHVGRSACYRFITCVIIIEKLHLYRNNPLLCVNGDNSLQTCSMSGNFSQKVSVADVSHKSTFMKRFTFHDTDSQAASQSTVFYCTLQVCASLMMDEEVCTFECVTELKYWGKTVQSSNWNKKTFCCILFVFAWMCCVSIFIFKFIIQF